MSQADVYELLLGSGRPMTVQEMVSCIDRTSVEAVRKSVRRLCDHGAVRRIPIVNGKLPGYAYEAIRHDRGHSLDDFILEAMGRRHGSRHARDPERRRS